MHSLPQALASLAQYPQFIVWKEVPRPGLKPDKVPVNPHSLHNATAHDPNNWLPADAAMSIAQGLGRPYGFGFVFTAADPFFFVDIDDCLVDDKWSPHAMQLLAHFKGGGVEVSHSGKGLHIFGCGAIPPSPIGWATKSKDGLTEFYYDKRFVALTGDRAMGDAGSDHTAALATFCPQYMGARAAAHTSADWTTEPVPEYAALTDDELLTRAMRARSVAGTFGAKATFEQLWTADADALAGTYPDKHGMRAYDESRADMALAQHLAFWTGKDCERILTLMQQSSLARHKWEARGEGYLQRTILRAVGLQTSVYTKSKDSKGLQSERDSRLATGADTVLSSSDADTDADAPTRVTGHQLMTVNQQLEYFRGCVYVRAMHQMSTPGGAMLKPDQFRASYGGYLFCMDSLNDKTTKNAWEAVVESQAIRWPKVDDMIFRPLLEPGAILALRGRRYVNSYAPIESAATPGDPGPFLAHVRKLLPDERDREILLSYLAACVQLIGYKFQWCPVVQGVQGNGKSLLSSVVAYAIGEQYCHQLDANDLENKFNPWIEGNLFVIVEEIRVQGKYQVADRLKIFITNKRVPVQGKGTNQRTGDNFANFLMNSNYKDAVHKTANDRRYAPFYTAQQTVEDLERDGMSNGYFRELWAWLEDGGFAVVAHYLATRPITCDLMGRAPVTTSTGEAVCESLGTAEQIVLEAVESEQPGFREGLICSSMTSVLLRDARKPLHPKALTAMLSKLGYTRHPAPDGRIVRINGAARRIYVHNTSPHRGLKTTQQLSAAWRMAMARQLEED